jgi:hypothetical protein
MLATLVVLLTSALITQTQETASGRELFSDPSFEQGFALTAASHPAPKVELGILQTTSTPPTAPPKWRMAQWASRFLLEPGVCKNEDKNQWIAETPGKRVVVDRTQPGQTCLHLETLGIPEYAGHIRAYGEAWPHLLIEQSFENSIRLQPLKRLDFSIEMRVPYCKPAPDAKLDPSLHTTQVSAYWTIHNVTSDNPDYQDMIWFGIPFFDARWDIPGPNYSLDAGKDDASHKFICLLDGKRFWKGPTGDGQWRRLNANLHELIREALAISQKHGYLKNTRFEDLAITSFNLGWEVPGPYDAAFEFREMSMKAFE